MWLSFAHLGIYISSVLLIAAFMKWLGRYAGGITLAVAIGVPVVTYLMFEKWFLVPLPKGPIGVTDWGYEFACAPPRDRRIKK